MAALGRGRPGRLRLLAFAAVLLLAGAALLRVDARLPGLLGDDCAVRVAGQDVGLTLPQARDLTTLALVARRDGSTQAALAAAVQSSLSDAGDDGRVTADSAAGEFRRSAGPPTATSTSLARALLGFGEDRLTCRADRDHVRRQAEGRSGLTPRAERARAALLAAAGPLPVGGFAPGGVRSGHVRGSAHYEGRAVDVFFRPVGPEERRRGWTTAQWLVAHAEPLDLDVLIFDRRIWSTEHAGDGWRTYRPPGGPTADAVLLHLDHVHLDVLRG